MWTSFLSKEGGIGRDGEEGVSLGGRRKEQRSTSSSSSLEGRRLERPSLPLEVLLIISELVYTQRSKVRE